MDELSELEGRIQTRLAAAQEQRQAQRQQQRQEMAEVEHRTTRFNEIATPLFEGILRPRIEKLVSMFPNAKLLTAESGHPHQLACSLERTDNFPATAKLTLGLGPDADMENLVASYALEIMPVFFQFQRCDQTAIPLAGFDHKLIAGWFDEKILRFVDTYLQIEHIDQYQQDNLVIDPVCGMRLNKASAACQLDYSGRSYFFCVDECRQKFAAEPLRYLPTVPK